MPKKKKSKIKGIPLHLSEMDEVNGQEKSVISAESWFSDTDPENSVKVIQDIFKGKVDPDVVSMVFSECEFNVDQAVETLFALVDDTNNEASGMDNKGTEACDKTYSLDCSASDHDMNKNHSLYDWPTLQSACSVRPHYVKHERHCAKNSTTIVKPSSPQPYAISSEALDMSTNNDKQYSKAADVTRTAQDKCSSSEFHEEQNKLLPPSLDKTIENICKSYKSSIQQSSSEQSVNETLIQDLQKCNFGNSFLNENNQHAFIVPKFTMSTEVISNTSFTTLPNSEILQQTPSFVKCLNQSNIAKNDNTLKNVITNDLIQYHSWPEEENQFRADNSKMSARETVNAYIRIGKKLLVILRGLPGSGKSTLAWQLCSEFSGSVFSTDDFFIRGNKYIMDYSALSDAHEWNRRRAAAAMANGDCLVIIDNTNVEAWEIKPYVALGLKYGYFIEIFEPETSWKFNLNQLAKRNTHGVSKAKITQMLERYDHNISLGDIIDEINNMHSNNSAMAINSRNFSSPHSFLHSQSEISELYLSKQENGYQQVMNDFNVKPCSDSADYEMPLSFCTTQSLDVIDEIRSKDTHENDCSNSLSVENYGAASTVCNILDFDKNSRIEMEGEKNLCLDELIGLLYESEESLSRHTSLSCSSQDVSAWEAITELDDDFLWTAEALPTESKSWVTKSELNKIDETNAIIEEDVNLLVEDVAEISSLEFNVASHETNSSKSLDDNAATTEICAKTQNCNEKEIVSEMCSALFVNSDGKVGEISANKINTVNNEINSERSNKIPNCTDKNPVSEKMCQELNWKESACILNLTEDNVSLPFCTQYVKEFSCKHSDDLSSSQKNSGDNNDSFNDDIQNGNAVTSSKQMTCLSDTFDSKLELKEDIVIWEEGIVDNSDWDSDKSIDNNSLHKTEPKPQRKSNRQKKGKFQSDNATTNSEVHFCNNIGDVHNQDNTTAHQNLTGNRNSQVIGNGEQSKSYWTRSNKKSKVAARLTRGLENKHKAKSDGEEHCAYFGNDKIQEQNGLFKEHICLSSNTTKEDSTTQICFRDFILLQNSNYSNVCHNKHFKMNNTESKESLHSPYNETEYSKKENSNIYSSSHQNIISEEQKLSLLNSLQHYFPSVSEQDLQDALEYSHYNLGESIGVLISFGYSLTNKELMPSAVERILSSCHKKTEKKCNVKNISKGQIPEDSLNIAEALEDIEISSNNDCQSITDDVDEKKSVLPKSLESLKLTLDPALAFKLQELFGPVDFYSSSDADSPNDRTLTVNMELAKMLYHCWRKSLKRHLDNKVMVNNEVVCVDKTNVSTQDSTESMEKKESNIVELPKVFPSGFCNEDGKNVDTAAPLFMPSNNTENNMCADEASQQNCIATKSMEKLPLKEIIDIELAIQDLD